MASVGDRSALEIERRRFGASGEAGGLRIALAAIAAVVILRLPLAATANLAEDEAYYWLWSMNLAGGYYDHPPMIAVWIRAGTSIFGQTEFGIRFASLVSAIAGSYLLYCASFSLFRDRAAAWICVIWMNAALLGNAAAILATPDVPLAFFTTAALFFLAKLIETGRGAWWYAIGASLGLAFMSKYTVALLLPGLALWAIASAEGRRWLARPEPYLGAVIALVTIAPVVLWNYEHDWASFAKQAHHGIKDKPASALLSVAEFFGGQAGLATPLIFFFCLFGSAYALVRGLRWGESRWLLLGALTAPVFAFFFIHAAGQKIQANWPGFVYPAAILAAVHGFRAFSEEARTPAWMRVSFRYAPWAAVSFTLVAFLQLAAGPIPIEAKKDPTARMKGWAQLGGDVKRLKADYGAGVVLTERYAVTGELAFYGPGADDVVQINERIRYANFPAPGEARLKAAPALFVLRKGADPAPVLSHFEESQKIAALVKQGGFRPGDLYEAYLLKGYRGGLFAVDRR